MTDTAALFEPVKMGNATLQNRVLMAPLTRNRAHSDGTPKDIAAEYYQQRASAGLIISEATQISALGKGYLDTPGIYTDSHVQAWKKITDAVHERGGIIYCQLWHVGRISHTSLLPNGQSPVSSSAIRANAQTFTANGFEDTSEPIALDKSGIEATIADYVNASEMAKKAGFDGVEIHAANGYLIDQFLQDGVNKRTDEYGGSVTNRTRFLKEVTEAVLSVWKPGEVGMRVSPLGQANDMSESTPIILFGNVYDYALEKNLAYLHVVESFPGNEQSPEDENFMKELRERYKGFYMANGGYNSETGADAIINHHADAISYGRPFIANPDLPERYKTGADLNEADQDTFYGGGKEGYTDYPFMNT